MTRTKQIVAAIGALIALAVTWYTTGQFDAEEILLAVIELATVLGVGKIPNRPKA